jgi:hypothetical protein
MDLCSTDMNCRLDPQICGPLFRPNREEEAERQSLMLLHLSSYDQGTIAL